MAGVTESNNWSDEVYRIELEDPVEGGEEGVNNRGPKQLAGRTNWLRLMISAICAAEGVPVVNDETTQLLTALDSRIGNAISALVDSSPAALDTLNELAAALGDDPNFATTVTNALALKAPLASPALTGTPTAPTAAPGTNNTQLATTEYVDRALNERDYKQSCRVASTANINTAAPGANIDGIAMVAGNRALLKDQTTPAQNGIWIWNGAAVAMTRAADADDGAELNSGAVIPIEVGTVNADSLWKLDTDGVVTIGVTALSFSPINNVAIKGSQTFTASGTFNIPAGVTEVIVQIWGAGGGGGSGTSAAAGGGGGGAGAFAEKRVIGLTPGGSVSVTVGVGGTGGNTGNGGNGGTTSFGAHCSATGGNGGSAAFTTGNTGSLGGTASGGDLNFNGGPGDTAEATTGGMGGQSPRGGAGGLPGYSGGGGAGSLPGGGGGGGDNGPTSLGGVGGGGMVFVRWGY